MTGLKAVLGRSAALAAAAFLTLASPLSGLVAEGETRPLFAGGEVRPLFTGYTPPAFSQTWAGSALVTNPYGTSGAVSGSTFLLNGYGCANVTATLPYDGTYTLSASLGFSGASGSAVIQAGYDNDLFPTSTGAWYFLANSSTGAGTYAWTSFMRAGVHKLCLGLYNPSNAFAATQPFWGSVVVNSLTLSSPGFAPRPEPATGARKASLQPYSSFSPWNTAIGTGATWDTSSSEATTLKSLALNINTPSYYGLNVYQGSVTDPVWKVVMNGDFSYPLQSGYNPPTFWMNLPAGWTISGPNNANGDRHVGGFSPDKRTFFNFYGCTTKDPNGATNFNSNTTGTLYCGQGQVEDAITGSGANAYAWAAGVIRLEDTQAGVINHALRYSIGKDVSLAGSTNVAGIAWSPATQRSDYCGPGSCSPAGFQQYTGTASRGILYGRTLGIPASVDLTALQAAYRADLVATGSGYATGDTCTNAAGTWKLTVSAGAVQYVTPQSMTPFFTPQSNATTIACTATSGTGTGLTMTPNYRGLSSAGLMLATSMQNFPSYARDTGGTSAINFYVDQNLVGTSWLSAAQGDLPLFSQTLAIMSNQTPATVNGGGTPRVATQAGALAQ